MIHLERLYNEDKQTVGKGKIIIDKKIMYEFHTLELPWLKNQRYISCIPQGRYQVKKRKSERFWDHFHLINVPDRNLILIHNGNFYHDTKGCILVGEGLADINGDGYRDVTHSRQAMEMLNILLPDRFDIVITKPLTLTT